MDRFKKKVEIIFLLALITLISFTIVHLMLRQLSYNIDKNKNNNIEYNTNKYNTNNEENPKTSEYWPGVPFIHINYDNWSENDLDYIQNKTGTPDDPHIIENVTINAAGSGSCIFIENSNEYFIIRNCTLINSGSDPLDAGIKFENATNGQLINNNCSFNKIGMYLASSNNTKIYQNCVQNNTIGICLDLSSSNNSVLKNNVSTNSDIGIYLWENTNNNIVNDNYLCNNVGFLGRSPGISLRLSYNNTISGNEIFNNNKGIYLWENSSNNIVSNNVVNNNSMHGIMLFQSNNNTIKQNKIINNKQDGINLQNIFNLDISKNNTITENFIANNTMYGVKFDGKTANNTIYKNAFIGNLLSHAQDEGIDNKWDDGSIGNYWDNYTDLGPEAVDANGDNIGDINYTVLGNAKANDTKPIWKLKVFITIFWPAPNLTFSFFAPAFNIKVEHIVEAITIDTMWYTIDEGKTNYTFTENGQINQIAYNNLPNGPIKIVFYANDSFGNVGFNEILITKSAIYSGSITIDINLTIPTEGESANETEELLTIISLGLTIGSICAISATSIYYYETKVKISKSIQPLKKKKFEKKIFPVLSSKEILDNIINKMLLLKIFDDLQPKQEISRLEKVKLSLISEELLDQIDKIDFEENNKIEFIREMLCLSPNERQEVVDNILKKVKSERFLVLSSRNILENMHDRERINQNFDKEKSKNKASQINRLTLITEEFLNNVDKIDFEENNKIEFVREMLGLSPNERKEIIDNILNRLNSDELKDKT